MTTAQKNLMDRIAREGNARVRADDWDTFNAAGELVAEGILEEVGNGNDRGLPFLVVRLRARKAS